MTDDVPQIIERRKHSANCDKMNTAIESSTRRWELIVFPALFAFIILAAYGFYMVYSLANDVHFLALSVDSNMTIMSSTMTTMGDNVAKLSSDVNIMSGNLESIDNKMTDITAMRKDMDEINQTIAQLNQSINIMTQSTYHLSRDMHTSSRPFSMFNSMMPW
jgi:peptidoglycan hydrolase CwlO-like protein